MDKLFLFTVIALLGINTVMCILCQGEKCCKDLGCFPLGYPWCSPWRPIPPPKCPDECPVKYTFYSGRYTTHNSTVSGWPIGSLDKTGFDPSKKTVIVIHGWKFHTNAPQFSAYKLIIDAYFECFDVNIIFVDYGSCYQDDYPQSVSNTRVFAANIARFIKLLMVDYGCTADQFQLVGTSLGAQISGLIGKQIKGLTIIGLDPAGPLFQFAENDVKLTKEDGAFVVIYHTTRLTFGIALPQGHIDFYINGAVVQPACDRELFRDILLDPILTNIIVDAINYTVCPHAASMYYYAAAVRGFCTNCTMWGVKSDATEYIFNTATGGHITKYLANPRNCNLDTCSPAGVEAIDYPARGSFLLATHDKQPYCIHYPEVDQRMKTLLEEYKKSKE